MLSLRAYVGKKTDDNRTPPSWPSAAIPQMLREGSRLTRKQALSSRSEMSSTMNSVENGVSQHPSSASPSILGKADWQQRSNHKKRRKGPEQPQRHCGAGEEGGSWSLFPLPWTRYPSSQYTSASKCSNGTSSQERVPSFSGHFMSLTRVAASQTLPEPVALRILVPRLSSLPDKSGHEGANKCWPKRHLFAQRSHIAHATYSFDCSSVPFDSWRPSVISPATRLEPRSRALWAGMRFLRRGKMTSA
jgi:hypothetical protein